MGGKDAIIVDSETDLDEAVEEVALSAFGFQGQKCSACSRAIVNETLYDKFVEKVAKRAKSSTDAMVGAHPFGGFNMSGTDSKAGGRDYLSLFMQAKSIAEKIR